MSISNRSFGATVEFGHDVDYSTLHYVYTFSCWFLPEYIDIVLFFDKSISLHPCLQRKACNPCVMTLLCNIWNIMSHFLNSLKCAMNHGHSHMASCGVDVALELFRQALLPHDPGLVDCVDNPILSALSSAAAATEALGPVCEAREGLCETICQEVPSYQPKGTRDAEVLELLMQLGKNSDTKFCSAYKGLNGCTACGKNKYSTVYTEPTLFYDQSVNAAHPSNLAAGIEYALVRHARHQWGLQPGACQNPRHEQNQVHINGNMIMADHMMVSFGLSHECRNTQSPPLTVPECITLFQEDYILAGAIQMEPSHFIAIVHRNAKFVVIDDCKENVSEFSTFAGAVARDPNDIKQFKQLSAWDRGIHVVVFSKASIHQTSPSPLSHYSSQAIDSSLVVMPQFPLACNVIKPAASKLHGFQKTSIVRSSSLHDASHQPSIPDGPQSNCGPSCMLGCGHGSNPQKIGDIHPSSIDDASSQHRNIPLVQSSSLHDASHHPSIPDGPQSNCGPSCMPGCGHGSNPQKIGDIHPSSIDDALSQHRNIPLVQSSSLHDASHHPSIPDGPQSNCGPSCIPGCGHGSNPQKIGDIHPSSIDDALSQHRNIPVPLVQSSSLHDASHHPIIPDGPQSNCGPSCIPGCGHGSNPQKIGDIHPSSIDDASSQHRNIPLGPQSNCKPGRKKTKFIKSSAVHDSSSHHHIANATQSNCEQVSHKTNTAVPKNKTCAAKRGTSSCPDISHDSTDHMFLHVSTHATGLANCHEVDMCGHILTYGTWEDQLYVNAKEAFTCAGMGSYVTKHGYHTKLLPHLAKYTDEHKGIFLMYKKDYWIRLNALTFLLQDKKLCAHAQTKKNALLGAISKTKFACISQKGQRTEEPNILFCAEEIVGPLVHEFKLVFDEKSITCGWLDGKT